MADTGNDVFEIMRTTRAMRRLKPDPVPDELVKKILEAGICAANGGNTQRWRFIVIKDPQIKKDVQVVYKRAFENGQYAYGAALALVLVVIGIAASLLMWRFLDMKRLLQTPRIEVQ